MLSLRQAPSPRWGPIDARAVVSHLVALARSQEQRRIEVAEAAALGEDEGRRDRQRRTMRAPDHQAEPARLRRFSQRQRFRQAAALVELDVDELVAVGDGVEAGARMAALVGAERNAEVAPGQGRVMFAMQRLLDQGDAEVAGDGG